MLFLIGGSMSRYEKVKIWMDKSDWRMWVAIGIAIVMSLSFLTNLLVDIQVKNARKQVMAMIDREEDAIKQSRIAAEARDNKVDAAFDDAFSKNQDVMDQAMNDARKEKNHLENIKE